MNFLKLVFLIVLISANVSWWMMFLMAKVLEKYIDPLTEALEKLIDVKIELHDLDKR